MLDLRAISACDEEAFPFASNLFDEDDPVGLLLRLSVMWADGTPAADARLDLSHQAPVGREPIGSADRSVRASQFADAHGFVSFQTVFPARADDGDTTLDLRVLPQTEGDAVGTCRLTLPENVVAWVEETVPAYGRHRDGGGFAWHVGREAYVMDATLALRPPQTAQPLRA